MEAIIDPEEIWRAWCDGWRYGRSARLERTLSLYQPAPPECETYGGPCIGRGECDRERGQQN